uniref:GPI ethanolamine phosphate transferase 3 n=1 Tax=Anthurium amnicola TaxID=1678845 RepID=A0A1D1Y464_9ARAE
MIRLLHQSPRTLKPPPLENPNSIQSQLGDLNKSVAVRSIISRSVPNILVGRNCGGMKPDVMILPYVARVPFGTNGCFHGIPSAVTCKLPCSSICDLKGSLFGANEAAKPRMLSISLLVEPRQ